MTPFGQERAWGSPEEGHLLTCAKVAPFACSFPASVSSAPTAHEPLAVKVTSPHLLETLEQLQMNFSLPDVVF